MTACSSILPSTAANAPATQNTITQEECEEVIKRFKKSVQDALAQVRG